MVSNNPELYKPDVDNAVREHGFVYIEDLAVSGVLLALKRGGTSTVDALGIGPILRSIDTTQVEDLHAGISEALVKVDKRWRRRGARVELPDFPGVSAFKDYGKRPCVEARKLDFRQINTSFVASKELDVASLTGFLAFHARGYDYSNEVDGLAQRVIDAHREDSRLFESLPV